MMKTGARTPLFLPSSDAEEYGSERDVGDFQDAVDNGHYWQNIFGAASTGDVKVVNLTFCLSWLRCSDVMVSILRVPPRAMVVQKNESE